MTRRMQGRKTTLNKTGRNESGAFWKAEKNGSAKDQRREVRELAIGDILWSCLADKDENRFKGTIINESESGLCLLTLAPIKVGSVLRIYGEDRVAVRDATVIWSRKGAANIYKSGLLLSEL
jgi:hypothetical protein